MSNYNDLEFCINTFTDFMENKSKYRIDPIIISEVTIEYLIKPNDFDYQDILKNLEFVKKNNNKNIYNAKNYEVHISEYTGNSNLIGTRENIGLLYNYVLSELVTIEGHDNILINLLNFVIKKSNIKEKIKNLDDFEDELLISIYEKRSDNITFDEYIINNKLEVADYREIFRSILEILIVINKKLKNFRHNNLNIESIRINKNNKIKITNFENSTCEQMEKIFGIKQEKLNPYYDIHYFFSSLMYFAKSKNINLDKEIIEFIESIIPKKYRNFTKDYKLDEKIYNNYDESFIIPKYILEKNNFFNTNIVKNMEITASPINENKLNTDNIDSLTESVNSFSRMLAKNIKYKNKKTYSKYNNINSMIKGTRNLYVPNRKFIGEGTMDSDSNDTNDTNVLQQVEKDNRKARKNKDEDNRKNNKRSEEDDISETEETEISGESSQVSDELQARMKNLKSKKSTSKKSTSKKSGSKKLKSKKSGSKKSRSTKVSESSFLESLSSSASNIVNTVQQGLHKTSKSVGDLVANSQELVDSFVKKVSDKAKNTIYQEPSTPAPPTGGNRIADFLGHVPQMNSNLPMTTIAGYENGFGGQMMNQPMVMPQQMVPTMMSPVMSEMAMSPAMGMQQSIPMMGNQIMPNMMSNMMPNMMPQMGVNSVTLQEGSMAPQQVPQLTPQQGGKSSDFKNEKVVLKWKKDFFF